VFQMTEVIQMILLIEGARAADRQQAQ